MNILIVYAHPEPKSFNGALKDLAVLELTALGHQVKVSDLYAPKHAYTPYGMDGDIHEKILFHINHGILYFAGLEPVEPFIAWTPSHDEEERKQYLEEYKQRFHNLSEIPSIPYHPHSHYDEHHQLKIEYR